MNKDRILSETQSLCPECFARIPAFRVASGDGVYLEKTCKEHGTYRTVIWRGKPAFGKWVRVKIPSTPKACFTEAEKGCPFDCGLCTAHGQHTCTALLEITQRCNLRCPVCFASADAAPESDPDMATIRFWYDRVSEAGGTCNIQLSGGEPTVRDDLPAIVEMGRKAGFGFIQVNTNGLRLGTEKDFARKLADAGLASVFLQFDGTDDAIHKKLRGRALMDIKRRAVENCIKAGIGVVLVPVLVPGVNTDNIGDILRFGLDYAPGVRGVHFQPVSYFGRYPQPPADRDRITIPEVITALADQTGDMIRPEHFRPPGCEHALCSFHGNYMILPDGQLKALTGNGGNSCCGPEKAEEGARQAISSVARQWAAPLTPVCSCNSPEPASTPDDFDAFLARAKTHIFAISGMAFQDVWTIDLERLKGCCIHTVSPDGRLIPFCAYNVTNAHGEALYRGQCG
ncbi:radical SAM protein [Desulfonema ishimotonii]|uniref:Radical SAM protein n=1 Tax=Desulfonema ishimotonii TaxID=45657 RepID=A0A401FR43_9BACT|nr:radical SAM (seleno)protein TrsS [Desulfonema ishimotonii]GBC59430.1 radical SAM protein [Desulfonema ishimotonii]